MLKQALTDSLLYGTAATLPRIAGFLLLPIVTRLLGAADYGAFDLLFVFGAVVHLVVPLDIGQAVARQWPDAGDGSSRRALASTSFWFAVIVYSAFALAAVFFAPDLVCGLLDDSARTAEVRAAAVAIAVSGLVLLAQNQFRWQMRARAFTAIAIVQAFAAPGCAIALAFATGKGLVAFLWGHAIGQALVLAACIVLLRDIYALRFSAERLRRLLAFSAPLVPAGLALLCAQYVDRVMVKELLSLDQLGLYGVGVRIGSIVAIAVIGLQLTVTPLVYRYAGQPDTAPVVAKLFTIACAGALVLATGLGLFARELVNVVSGPGFEGAAAAVYPAALATLAASLYSYAPGLALGNRTGTIALVNVASAVLSVVLCWLLIPMLGFAGAAVALLIGALTGFCLLARLGRRFLRVPYPWLSLALLAAGSALLVLQGHSVSGALRAGLLAVFGVVTLGVLLRLQTLSIPRGVRKTE